jgi:SEL1 protein
MKSSLKKVTIIYHIIMSINFFSVVNLSYDSDLPSIEITSLLDQSSRKKSPTDDEDVVQYYHHNADAGDMNAQLTLGHMYYFGIRGVQRNYQVANRYYSFAAAQGNAAAMAQLGQMHVDGLGVVQSNETAIQYFKKASEKGNAHATYGLGYMYFHGFGVPKDLKLAYKYFKAAADAGYAEAQFSLGTMYYSGEGAERSESLAIQYFTVASQQYHTRAIFNLAQIYLHGAGTRASCPMAVELYKKVAERGVWASELKKAHKSYIDGDYEHSIMLYTRLAEEGVRTAQINAAYMFSLEQGYFFENANNISYLLWKRAADQGDSSALRIIGDYYYYGKLGLNADLAKASEYYRGASEKKDVHATFNLGFMHQFGIGVDQDLHLAKRYFDLCADLDQKAYYPSAIMNYGLYLHRWVVRNFGQYLGVDPALGSDPITPEEAKSSKKEPIPSSEKEEEEIDEDELYNELMELLGGVFNFENLVLEDILLLGLSFLLAIIIFFRQHRREILEEDDDRNRNQNQLNR